MISVLLKPLGEDVFCIGKKFLVFNLVRRNLKVKYRDSFLGILWTLLAPLAMTAVYYFVFKVVLRVQMPYHLVFVLAGVLSWNFVAQSIFEGMAAVVENISLVNKVPIPLQVFSFVACSTNLITYILSLPILIGAAYFSGLSFHSAHLALPFYGLCLFIMTYGIALTLSMFYVLFRDLRHITSIVLQIWFYATPVIYDERMVPEKYQWVLSLNPMGCLFSDLHSIWIRGELPSLQHFITVGSWALVALLISAWVYKSFSRGLVEQI